MRTTRPPFGRLSAVLVCLAGAAFGQNDGDYSDYKWATALAEAPYGFDDMAETVFNRMINDSGRSAQDKLLGRSGIADLKRKQAASAVGLDAKMKLLDESISAIRAVKKEWPDKNSDGYFDVLFKVTGMLQQRGETAMEFALDPQTPAAKVDELKAKAAGDFTEAKTDLDAVRQQFKNADSEKERDKWRLRSQAWLSYCIMLYSEGMAAKDGSVQQGTSLADAAKELDDFVLEYESTEDEESMLGSLYGQVYTGKVARARKELDRAIAAYETVLGYVRWDSKGSIPGAVQNLVELAYLELLDGLNVERRFEDARAQGEKMEANFKAKKLELGVRGRAARVEFAKACFASGDFARTLVVASEVSRDGKNDASGLRAAKLIAQVIASATDKRQFDAEVLLNAAKGAYQESLQQPEKRAEAVAYYRMAIPLLDQIKDEKVRYSAGLSAWLRYADCLQNDGLLLEAAHACIEGYRSTWGAKSDLLQGDAEQAEAAKIATKLRRLGEDVSRDSKSKDGEKIVAEFNDLLAKFPKPKDLIFSPGDAKFEEAQKLEAQKKFEEAIAAYHEVSGKPPEYKGGLGGRYAERAIVKANTCAAKLAKQRVERKDPGAQAALEAALAGFDGYLKMSSGGAVETDPTKLQARKQAQAEAKWQYSELKIDLANLQQDEAAKAKNFRDVVAMLTGFEQLHATEQDLCVFAAANRVEAFIGLKDLPNARTAYAGLKKIGPAHLKTGEVANKLGKAVKAVADEKKKALDPKKDEAEIAKLFPDYLEAAGYYREWLLQPGNKGANQLSNWESIARMYFDADGLNDAAELYRTCLEKFGNVSTSKVDDLQRCRYYLARANDRISDALIAEGKDASRLLAETGRLMSDHLMKDDSKYKSSREVWRIAARTWGGFMTKKGGNLSYFAGLGDFAKAFDVWKNKIKQGAEQGSDEWWEATFYQYYLALKDAEFNKNAALKDQLKTSLKSLRSTSGGEFGGPKWKPWFEWFERQLL